MRAIDASKNAHRKRLRTVFNPLISPENLWPRQGSAATGFGGTGTAAEVRGCTAIGRSTAPPQSDTGATAPAHETARSSASWLSSARRKGFDKNTNVSDNGTIATSNAAPAISAADGDPQASCKWPAAKGPTAINV